MAFTCVCYASAWFSIKTSPLRGFVPMNFIKNNTTFMIVDSVFCDYVLFTGSDPMGRGGDSVEIGNVDSVFQNCHTNTGKGSINFYNVRINSAGDASPGGEVI